MISTSPGSCAGDALVDGLVDRVADGADLQPRGDAVDLGDDALLALDGDRCAPCSTASSGCPPRSTRRTRKPRAKSEREHREGDLRRRSRADGDDEADGGDRAPHDRVGAPERQQGEGGDAEQAADEVELVGVEVGELLEGAGDAVADARHHGGDGEEDDGQDHPARRSRGVQAEEDERAAGDAHLHLEQRARARSAWPAPPARTGTATAGRGSSTGTRGRCRGSCRAARRWRSTPGRARWRRASGSGPAR